MLETTNPKIGVIFPNKDKEEPDRRVIGLLNVIKANALKSKLFVQSERRGRFYGWIDIDVSSTSFNSISFCSSSGSCIDSDGD